MSVVNGGKTICTNHHRCTMTNFHHRCTEYTEFVFPFCPITRCRSAKSHCPSGKVAYVISPSTRFAEFGRTHHRMCEDKNIFLPRGAGLRILHHRDTECAEADIPYRLKLPQSGSPNGSTLGQMESPLWKK